MGKASADFVTLTSNLTTAAAATPPRRHRRRRRPLLLLRHRQHGWKRKGRGKEELLSRNGPAALEGSLGGAIPTVNQKYNLSFGCAPDH